MQKRNEETFGDISGVHVIADNLIIAATTEQERDAILGKIFDQVGDKGVPSNYGKIQFKVSEVEYMGNLSQTQKRLRLSLICRRQPTYPPFTWVYWA